MMTAASDDFGMYLNNDVNSPHAKRRSVPVTKLPICVCTPHAWLIAVLVNDPVTFQTKFI